MLTACGGSDSSSSSTTSTNNSNTGNTPIPGTTFQQWAAVDLSTGSDDLDINISQNTIDNGKAYSKQIVGEADNSFIVTPNGVYEDGEEHPQYGTYQGLLTVNGNQWIHSPYSSINSTDLKITTTYKLLDISNKEIFPTILPQEYIDLKYNLNESDLSAIAANYINSIKPIKFPQGSTCLQLQEISNSEEYVDLEIDEPENQSFLAAAWNTLATDPNAIQKVFKNTIAYFSDDENDEGFAKYNEQYYEATYYKKGVEFNLSDIINEWNSFKSSSNPAEVNARIDDQILLAENSCALYNPTAITAIQNTLVNYQ
ncbi:hypothetical protein BS636_10515 [Acinetobacter sp. LoGeW2-3]|nr:hypothetical protein BS636_10515 [Acinetobacter sp. LoGeW2-3]